MPFRKLTPPYRLAQKVAAPMGPDLSTGYIKVVNDNRDLDCFVCGSRAQVRFLLFASPVKGKRFYLRLCQLHIEELARKADTLKRSA